LSILENPEDFIDRYERAAEEVLAKFFKAGTSKQGVEINPLVENRFQSKFEWPREDMLGTLASGAETTEDTRVGSTVNPIQVHCQPVAGWNSDFNLIRGGYWLNSVQPSN
jgi:hypothetical protein